MVAALDSPGRQPASSGRRKHRSAHPFRDNIEVVVFAIVMALGLKVFALEAYQIPTGSMQPNLMGTGLLSEDQSRAQGAIHDRVLVDKLAYLLREPQRWEVVVFRYPLVAHNNYVKRLVGMPGEELMIQQGDIWTRPLGSTDDFHIERKPPSVQETLWRRVWPLSNAEPGRWSGWNIHGRTAREEGALRLQGEASLSLAAPVRDEYTHGYPDAIARRIPLAGARGSGRNVVSDLRLRLEATPEAGAGALEVELDAGPYPLRLRLDPAAGRVRLELPGAGSEEADFAFAPGAEVHLELAFWDHQALLALRGGAARIERLVALELAPQPATRNGVSLRSETGGWRLRPPRLDRDIHYLPPLNGAATPLWEIPEGHYFMLGDNTQNSLDSRDWQARILRLETADGGERLLRGDSLENGSDPFYNNPRWNDARDVMTFRDEFGNLYAIPLAEIQEEPPQAFPFVPREYVLGKAIAVFLPIPPFAPVARFKLVR